MAATAGIAVTRPKPIQSATFAANDCIPCPSLTRSGYMNGTARVRLRALRGYYEGAFIQEDVKCRAARKTGRRSSTPRQKSAIG